MNIEGVQTVNLNDPFPGQIRCRDNHAPRDERDVYVGEWNGSKADRKELVAKMRDNWGTIHGRVLPRRWKILDVKPKGESRAVVRMREMGLAE